MIFTVDKSKIRADYGNLTKFSKAKDVPYHKIHQVNGKSRLNSQININIVTKLINLGLGYWKQESK